MDTFRNPVNYLKIVINSRFAGKEPWHIVTVTASTILVSVWLYDFIFQDESELRKSISIYFFTLFIVGLIERIKKTVFRIAKRIPAIKKRLDKELENISQSFETDVRDRTKHLKYIIKLPTNGLSKDEINNSLVQNLNLGDYDWKNGLVSGAVYNFNEDLVYFLGKIYAHTSYTNPLHPDLFPGLCKMEAEVIRMTLNLFHGDEKACGAVTIILLNIILSIVELA